MRQRGTGRIEDRQSRARRLRVRMTRVGIVAVALVLATGTGCSDYKKLSAGGGPLDTVMYDVLGQDRDPSYYYQLVRDSHKECDFCYRCGDDPFLVDKNINAVQRLGDAEYGRLEGEAEVVELFTEVLLEDCSSLARASAANSLTRIAVKLPDYPGPRVEDRGSKFLAYAKELDRLFGEGQPCRPALTEGTKQRAIQLLTQIGNLDIIDTVVIRDSLKFFYGHQYLIDASDPQLRQAIDTALVKRMKALIHHALQAAVADEVSTVRADAIKGLKTLHDRTAVEVILQRLEYEPDWLVRLEIAEYLGSVGTREGVVALIGLLDDTNASVRHKAREALRRIARADYGYRIDHWKHWARTVDPAIDFGDEPEDEDPDQDRARGFGP